VSARADFVVGADGQGSIVRQKLGIEYERAGKPQLFVVYEFESGATIPQEVRIVLDSNTVSVLWPLSQNKGRWGFQWPESEAPADFPQKDRTRFTIAGTPGPEDSRHHLLRLLDAHAPWFQEDIKSVGWAVDIQFEHRLARRFGRDQAWLAGDSAHQTGPIGMQSMNIGFREGADLAARLTRILREKGLNPTISNAAWSGSNCLAGTAIPPQAAPPASGSGNAGEGFPDAFRPLEVN
jgi:3-(3-hydroxy-phenyl)propionate hydroxylase